MTVRPGWPSWPAGAGSWSRHSAVIGGGKPGRGKQTTSFSQRYLSRSSGGLIRRGQQGAKHENNSLVWSWPLAFVSVFCHAEQVQAQSRVQAARAAAEFIIERFGRPAAREGIEVLARKIESVAARFGDEAIVAAQKVGPQFFKVVEAAGVNGAKAVRIMATHGEPGVAWVLSRPKGHELLLQHGEEAAAVLIRHPGGIAEPVIGQFGGPAVKALQAVGPQGGRRLAMMLSEGELAKIGRTPEVLEVVAQYGDRAMEFIWKNKGALAVGAAPTPSSWILIHSSMAPRSCRMW